MDFVLSVWRSDILQHRLQIALAAVLLERLTLWPRHLLVSSNMFGKFNPYTLHVDARIARKDEIT